MADRDKKELNEDLETDCADENTYWPTLEQYDPHMRIMKKYGLYLAITENRMKKSNSSRPKR